MPMQKRRPNAVASFEVDPPGRANRARSRSCSRGPRKGETTEDVTTGNVAVLATALKGISGPSGTKRARSDANPSPAPTALAPALPRAEEARLLLQAEDLSLNALVAQAERHWTTTCLDDLQAEGRQLQETLQESLGSKERQILVDKTQSITRTELEAEVNCKKLRARAASIASQTQETQNRCDELATKIVVLSAQCSNTELLVDGERKKATDLLAASQTARRTAVSCERQGDIRFRQRVDVQNQLEQFQEELDEMVKAIVCASDSIGKVSQYILESTEEGLVQQKRLELESQLNKIKCHVQNLGGESFKTRVGSSLDDLSANVNDCRDMAGRTEKTYSQAAKIEKESKVASFVAQSTGDELAGLKVSSASSKERQEQFQEEFHKLSGELAACTDGLSTEEKKLAALCADRSRFTQELNVYERHEVFLTGKIRQNTQVREKFNSESEKQSNKLTRARREYTQLPLLVRAAERTCFGNLANAALARRAITMDLPESDLRKVVCKDIYDNLEAMQQYATKMRALWFVMPHMMQLTELSRLAICARAFRGAVHMGAPQACRHWSYSDEFFRTFPQSSRRCSGERTLRTRDKPIDFCSRLIEFLGAPPLVRHFVHLDLANAPILALQSVRLPGVLLAMPALATITYPADGWADPNAKRKFVQFCLARGVAAEMVGKK